MAFNRTLLLLAVTAATALCSRAGTVNVVNLSLGSRSGTIQKDDSFGGIFRGKVTLSRGKAYTLSLAKGAESLRLQTASYDFFSGKSQSDDAPRWANFQKVDDGVYVLQSSYWIPTDPASWDYYIYLTGPVGTAYTLTFSEGAKLPEGTETNPKEISIPKGTPQTFQGSVGMTGGSYYFKSSLTAGTRYWLGTTGGTSSARHSLAVLNASLAPQAVQVDEAYVVQNPNDEAVFFTPSKSGTYVFKVTTSSSGTVRLSANAIGGRPIGQHESDPVAFRETVTLTPGYVNSVGSRYYDDIIDERLYRFAAEAGNRVYLATSGAKTNLLVRFYDSTGKVLTEARSVGPTMLDVCAVMTVEKTGTNYVGVCENLDTEKDGTPSGRPVSFAMTLVEPQKGEPDDFDPADDVVLGATAVEVKPATAGMDVLTGDPEGSAEHALGMTDWQDVFKVSVRQGVTYRLAATFADKSVSTPLGLSCEAFVLKGGAEAAVPAETAAVSGDIAPGATTPLTIVAKANGTVYLRLSVANGRGYDYPAYRLHAVGSPTQGTGSLGVLTVATHGNPTASWSLDAEKTSYEGAAELLLPYGSHVVRFGKVTGFKALPEQVSVTVGEKPASAETWYCDEYDPVDDTAAGATAWTVPVIGKEAPLKRTLWRQDPEDNFAVAGKDGYFFDFALVDVVGDAVFSITNKNLGTLAKDVKAVRHLPLPTDPAKYYITVRNGGLAEETESYAISGGCANIGSIKFEKTKVDVNDTVAKVDFKVSRSAKDGAVSVRYGTKAGTAVPGVDYVAQNGVLTWADGENDKKTISVKLIPDLRPTYKAQPRTFTVELLPLEDEEIAASGAHAGEYKAQVLTPSATVTVKGTAKIAPGTIQLAGCDNPKKPVVTIRAGDTAEIALDRALGTDGLVGVTVVSAKGTANKSGETDFEPISTVINWADGVGGFAAPIVIRTKKTDGDFTGTKTFTLKLTALTSKSGDPVQYAKPTLAATAITVNIVNDKYEQNVTDFAKTLPKAAGVAMKEAKKDSWFRGADGEFYSVVSRTFKGPSRLWWGPSWDPFRTNLFVSAKGETVVMRSGDVYTNDLLEAAAAAAPTVDKAVVTNGLLKLAFDRVPDDEVREIDYRVYILENGAKVLRPGARSAVNLKLGDPETEIRPDADGNYMTNVAWKSTQQGGKYTWRVDSFFIGGTVTNTAKRAWSFTVQKPAEAGAALKVEGADDVYSASINLGVTYALKVAGPEVKSFTTASGTKLPNGLKLEQDNGTAAKPGTKDWYVRGYPTQAGDFQAVIQATYVGTPVLKSPTYVLKFHVAALPQTNEIKPLSPCVNKAVIEPCAEQVVSFKAEEGVTYRAFFLEKGQKSSSVPGKSLKLGDDETEREVSVVDGVASFPSEMAIGSKTNYTWVVYAYHEGGAVTNKSSTFSFDGAPLDADGHSYATNLRGHDAYGTEFEEGVSMRLRQRLPVEGDDVFEFYGEKLKSVAVVSGTGSLPAGLKLEQDKGTAKSPGSMKWRIHGTPTKAGTFQLAVQATMTNLVAKTSGTRTTYTAVETKAATRVITFVVEAVDAPSDLSFTLAGPGRFVYTATDARIPTERADKTETRTNYVSKTSETLKLSDVERLHSYEYVQLPVVAPRAPTVDKAVVAAGNVDLGFHRIADDEANGISYRAYLRNTRDTRVKLGSAETELEVRMDGDCAFATTNLAGNVSTWEWRVDSFFTDGPVTNAAKAAWKLSTLTPEAQAAGIATSVCGVDAYGVEVTNQTQVIRLLQGVKVDLTLGDAVGEVQDPDTSFAAVSGSGKLPDGLKIVQTAVKEGGTTIGKACSISGVPTKAGSYQVVVQRTSGGLKGATYALSFEVAALDYAIGTFNGVLAEDSLSSVSAADSLGSIKLTVSSAGKLSASVKVGKNTYSFSDSGFGSLMDEDLSAPGCTRTLTAQIALDKKVGSVACTHTLELTLKDGCSTNLVALGEVAGSAVLTLEVPDADGFVETVVYAANLYRDNSKSAAYAAAFAKFAGYYTVSLPILAPDLGKPQGNGYLTFTLDEKGKSAKAGGKLADGSSVSCSFVPALLGDLTDPVSCEVAVPLLQTASGVVFGGELRIAMAGMFDGETVPVVDSTAPLFWRSDAAAATYDGFDGWDYELAPSGGFYDKVVNLQAYYLNRDFSVEASDDLPEELLQEGYAFVAETHPNGQRLDLSVNAVTVDKQNLVKGADGHYDFAASANPSGVTISFNRATGVVTGDFYLYAENDARRQVKSGKFSHAGVLLLSRDAFSPLADNVWTAGYFLAPEAKIDGRKYKASLPFNILSIDLGEKDPWEDDLGEVPLGE